MLFFEELENRSVPAVNFAQVGDSLTVYGEPQAANVIVANGDSEHVSVHVNGNDYAFTNVERLVLIGGVANDLIVNNTVINSSIFGLEGDDFIQAFAGDDFVVSGQGKDIVRDFLGNNLIYTNDDQDADTVFGNRGGQTFIGVNDVHNLITSPVFVSFNTLYLLGNDTGVNFSVYPWEDDVLVVFNLNDQFGNQGILLNKSIKAVAFVGGEGDDFFANNTDLIDYVYGFDGKDFLVGGLGDYSLLDGGLGNDALILRAGEGEVV